MASDGWVAGPASDGQLGASDRTPRDLAGLRAGITGLASLATADLPLPELLIRVAEYAVGVIPGAEGAGVTLMERDRPDVLAASADFVARVDAIQYGLGEGPCISAALERRTIRSGSLAAATRWPRFGPEVVRLGVHSVLSLPMVIDDATVGAINVYAHDLHAFTDRAQELGEQFAGPAAVATHNAQVRHQSRRVAGQLRDALVRRAVVDRAIGILIAAGGRTVDEASELLVRMSRSAGTSVADTAQQVVATTTAEPGRSGTPSGTG